MEYSTVIVALVAIILIIVIIKLALSKILKIISILIILSSLAVYGFIKYDTANNSISFVKIFTEYSVDDMKKLYKEGKMSKTDSVRYECILEPLSQDLHKRFSDNELNELKKRRLKYAKEVYKSYQSQKSIIKEKFKRRNASQLFAEFDSETEKIKKK